MSQPSWLARHLCGAEVILVPTEWIGQLWKHARPWLYDIPHFDLHRARTRLLAGIDRLWLAVLDESYTGHANPYVGVVITTVSDRQPFKQPPTHVPKLFRRTDPADRRSLMVHLAGGHIVAWSDSAVERITAYAREQKCRQLYIMAKKDWGRYAVKFYSREWDIVAYSRDRTTRACGKAFPSRNKVGYYRVMLPYQRKLRKQDYEIGRFLPFEEKARERRKN